MAELVHKVAAGHLMPRQSVLRKTFFTYEIIINKTDFFTEFTLSMPVLSMPKYRGSAMTIFDNSLFFILDS